MNEDPFQQSPKPEPEDPMRNAQADVKKAFDDLVAAAKQAWTAGSEQARKTAEERVPKARDTVKNAAYEVSYDLAYGAHFAAALVRSLIPDTVGEASKKGAEAGEKAAEDFLRKRRGPEAESAPPPPPESPLS